jgi:hypothetical protein
VKPIPSWHQLPEQQYCTLLLLQMASLSHAPSDCISCLLGNEKMMPIRSTEKDVIVDGFSAGSNLGMVIYRLLIGFSQDKHTISGTISDAKSNETLIGVSIQIKGTSIYTATNEYGFYSITLPKGNYSLLVSYVGFQTEEKPFELNENIKLNVKLQEESKQLQEIVVSDTKEKTNIRKPEMSVNKLSIATIKQMPVVLGEVDIIKSLLFLPGVTNAGEGQSGFNVRGGGADQNLVLLDEATVYNSSHVFGFFSVFNPDAIKDLKLYKGGIPAKYGGRASSVLDIYQKDGNSNKLSMNGGIGWQSTFLSGFGTLPRKN